MLTSTLFQAEIADLDRKLEDRRFQADRQKQDFMMEKKLKEEQVLLLEREIANLEEETIE
jgi:hypothetical protein